MTATSFLSVNSLASSAVVRVTAGGPVRFFSHATISLAVRPPVCVCVCVGVGVCGCVGACMCVKPVQKTLSRGKLETTGHFVGI